MKKSIFFFLLFILFAFPCFSEEISPTRAKQIRITDAGSYYTGTEVEAALQEIGSGTLTGWTHSGTNIYPTTLTDYVGIGTATPWQELTVIGDITQSDPNPNHEFRISTDNSAYALHFNADGTNDPWGVWQFWKGTDTGTRFFISGSPIMWGDVNKNIGIGAGKYLNFSTPLGTDGYGIRDNAGTMQFKNLAGGWTDFGSGGGGPTYWEYTFLSESCVLDDDNPPAITVIESTGTGTPRFRVADFDATTDEIIYWTFIVPSDMAAGNWLADVSWYSNDLGANETCVWEIFVSATSEGDADTMAEQATGDTNYASEDVNTTEVNRLIQTTITISNLDNVSAGDVVTLRFSRDADGSNATDDLTSDARLVGVRLRIPRS